MPDPSDRDERAARLYAEAIRRWHLQHGIERWPQGPYSPPAAAYRERLQSFSAADLSQPGTRRDLAKAQRSGAFEVHAAAEVPLTLWSSLAREFGVEAAAPRNLYEAAGWILEIDREPAPPEDPSPRMTVRATSPEHLLDQARGFYADVVAAGGEGALGGLAALLSSSLERAPWLASHGTTTLLSAEVLGLEPVDALHDADDLRALVLRGDVKIRAVVGKRGAPGRRDNPLGPADTPGNPTTAE